MPVWLFTPDKNDKLSNVWDAVSQWHHSHFMPTISTLMWLSRSACHVLRWQPRESHRSSLWHFPIYKVLQGPTSSFIVNPSEGPFKGHWKGSGVLGRQLEVWTKNMSRWVSRVWYSSSMLVMLGCAHADTPFRRSSAGAEHWQVLWTDGLIISEGLIIY